MDQRDFILTSIMLPSLLTKGDGRFFRNSFTEFVSTGPTDYIRYAFKCLAIEGDLNLIKTLLDHLVEHTDVELSCLDLIDIFRVSHQKNKVVVILAAGLRKNSFPTFPLAYM